MQDLGASPSDQWFYDVKVLSQPCYDFSVDDVLAKWLTLILQTAVKYWS